MSKVNDIKNMKRQRKIVTPTQALAEVIGEEETTNQEINISLNEENNESTKEEIKKTIKEENNIERKRVSFDLRTDLHKQLKMQALVQDKKIYILIEEALEKYLGEKK